MVGHQEQSQRQRRRQEGASASSLLFRLHGRGNRFVVFDRERGRWLYGARRPGNTGRPHVPNALVARAITLFDGPQCRSHVTRQ